MIKMENMVMVELTKEELAFLGSALMCYRENTVGNASGAIKGMQIASKYEKIGVGQSTIRKLRQAALVAFGDPEKKWC